MSPAVRGSVGMPSTVDCRLVLPLSVGASLTLATLVPSARSTLLQAPVLPVQAPVLPEPEGGAALVERTELPDRALALLDVLRELLPEREQNLVPCVQPLAAELEVLQQVVVLPELPELQASFFPEYSIHNLPLQAGRQHFQSPEPVELPSCLPSFRRPEYCSDDS